MKSIVTLLNRSAHQLTILGCAFGLALMLAGCASTGGGGSSGRSVAELKAAADRGDAQAQFELGDAYYHGRGVPRDYTEANKWYQKATATYKTKTK